MTPPSAPTSPTSFYVPLGENRFTSTPATVGPWGPALQHGGPPMALVARALERLPGGAGMRLARVSMEILGPIALDEITVEAQVVRPGAKVSTLSASARVRDREVLRATAWRLATAPGRSPASPASTLEPIPALPGPQPQVFFPGLPSFGYGEALEWRFVEGGFDRLGPATVWTRARIPLVAGDVEQGAASMSPLERVLLMLDSANGISAELDGRRWTFVPVDLNVVLHRLPAPAAEWVGMAAKTTIGADGTGMVHARVFDEQGECGRSVHTLFVAPRP